MGGKLLKEGEMRRETNEVGERSETNEKGKT